MRSSFWDWYAALGYDALNVLLPYQALQRDVVAAASPAAGERVLVAGCGTGNFERLALRRTPDLQVDGVDFSARMLARARAKCAGQDAVRHHRQDLCGTLPFADAAFDLAVMCNVLYALPQREAALREIGRVVRPGGRFILCDRPPTSDPTLVSRAHFHAMRALPWPARLRHGALTLAALPALLAVAATNRKIQQRRDSGEYYFYAREEISDLLAQCGFSVQRIDAAYADQCWLLQAVRISGGAGGG